MPPDVLQASLHEPYTLNAGDKLRVIVFGQDSLSNVYAVDGAGRISMPLIGAVEARGLTTASLEKAIEGKLRNGFLREPKVSAEAPVKSKGTASCSTNTDTPLLRSTTSWSTAAGR